jgi:hypothetical protein
MQGRAFPWLLTCPLALAARNRCSRAEPLPIRLCRLGKRCWRRPSVSAVRRD